MNDRPIQPGDLVQVVRDCCGAHLGFTFTVRSIHPPRIDGHYWFCDQCGGKYTGTVAENGDVHAPIELKPPAVVFAPLPWLKRIPPLSEFEQTTTEEDAHA